MTKVDILQHIGEIETLDYVQTIADDDSVRKSYKHLSKILSGKICVHISKLSTLEKNKVIHICILKKIDFTFFLYILQSCVTR